MARRALFARVMTGIADINGGDEIGKRRRKPSRGDRRKRRGSRRRRKRQWGRYVAMAATATPHHVSTEAVRLAFGFRRQEARADTAAFHMAGAAASASATLASVWRFWRGVIDQHMPRAVLLFAWWHWRRSHGDGQCVSDKRRVGDSTGGSKGRNTGFTTVMAVPMQPPPRKSTFADAGVRSTDETEEAASYGNPWPAHFDDERGGASRRLRVRASSSPTLLRILHSCAD